MKRIFILLACCHVLSGIAYAQDTDSGATYEVIKDMPRFYLQMKERLTYPLSWQNNRDKDFDQWKEAAGKALRDCLEPAQPATDFNAEVVATEQRNGYKAHKVVVSLSAYSRVRGYLLVPDNKTEKLPAIVMFHDHGAHFSIGKEKMVRPFAVPDSVMADADDWSRRCYDNLYTADYFAEHGYVVFVTDALFWGERGRREGTRYDSQQALAANMLQMGMAWGSFIVWDDVRSVDYVSTLPYVDADKIGTLGFSMGAHRSWMTAAASEKVHASASICWMNVTDSLMTLTNNQNKGGSAYSMIIPNLRNYMDYPHVASLTCPRPALFINGTQDKLFPVEGVKEAYRQMREVWDSQQAGDRLVTKLYESPHFFNKEMHAEVLSFFDRWLK